MLNDTELRKLQKILPHNNTMEAFNDLLGITHDLYNLRPCPICAHRNLTYYSEGTNIPDGRVVCLTCGAHTKKYNTHDQRYIKAICLYRNMRSARESWNRGRVFIRKTQVQAQVQSQPRNSNDDSIRRFMESLGV